jgi:hypothetical protein
MTKLDSLVFNLAKKKLKKGIDIKKVTKSVKKHSKSIGISPDKILAKITAYNLANNADGKFELTKKVDKKEAIQVLESDDNMKDFIDPEMYKILRKPIRILRKGYPQLNKDTASLVLRKIENMGGAGKIGRGVLTSIINNTVDLYNRIRGVESDPRDHKLIGKEKHAIFMNDKGALVRAQFAGPETEIAKNLNELKRKHKNVKDIVKLENFVSETDKIALMHDLRYYIDGSSKSRYADEKMVEKLEESRKKGNSRFNVWPSLIGIKGKIKLEDMGIINKGKFASGDAEKLESKKDLKLMRKIKRRLEQEGYGQPKVRPIRRSADNWLDFVHQYSIEHKMDYKNALRIASPIYRQLQLNKK